jgi:hypothetical protein
MRALIYWTHSVKRYKSFYDTPVLRVPSVLIHPTYKTIIWTRMWYVLSSPHTVHCARVAQLPAHWYW